MESSVYGPSNEDLLLWALRAFVDEYDTDRRTWPDDMVDKLDNAHWTISEVTGLPRSDYTGPKTP